MKIIILGTAYPLRGGIAHYNALLYTHLKKRHDVEIISFKRQYPRFLFPGTTQEERGGKPLRMESAQLLDSINPLNWIRVALTIRKKHPDLIIFKYWLPFFASCFGTIAALSRWRTNTKVLCICDNVIPHERRWGDIVLTRFAFHFVDFFIVQSQAVERDLQKLFPHAPYTVVPHPVYEIFGTASSKNEAKAKLQLHEERMILFFGYVRPYKGLHLLLDAMPLVLNHLKLKLLVVGEFYEDEQSYRKKIKELGLEDAVVLVSEYVPNEKVRLYFSVADIVVLPYISATQSGIAQIAYNFDKPAIATDVGGLAEVVIDGKTGFIVPPNDPEKLAEAILRFYHEERESEFSTNIKVEKRKYSWENMVESIERLFKQH